jgi:hypothetical protein
MVIAMRMVARIFFFATEVTQGPFSSAHYTHIKHTPKPSCVICSGFEDTTKMSPRIRGTCPGDLDLTRPQPETETGLFASSDRTCNFFMRLSNESEVSILNSHGHNRPI